jgi:hypothetical protein
MKKVLLFWILALVPMIVISDCLLVPAAAVNAG